MIGASANGEIVEIDGVLFYYEKGIGVEKGLVCVNGDYYYASYRGRLAINTVVEVTETNCDLPKGTYTFGADGKMIKA
jgi:glucan-binding YG repeat protein